MMNFFRALRKILILLLIVALIALSFYYYFQRKPVEAATTIDTSTVGQATSYSLQRKTFYDTVNKVNWTFYYNGTDIEYSYATGYASSWTSAGTYNDSESNDFSIWFSSESGTGYVYMAYQVSGAGVKVVKGTLSSTSISWGTATTADATAGDAAVSVALSNTGVIWITYNNTSVTTVYAASSVNAYDPSSWNAESTLLSQSQSFNVGIVPLNTSGYMYAVFAACNTAGADTLYFQGKLYNGSWQATSTISTLTVAGGACPGTQGTDIGSVASSSSADEIHLAYMDMSSSGTTGEIIYKLGNSCTTTCSWGSAVTLSDSTGSSQYPSITIDTNNSNKLYAFWYKNTGGNAKVVYKSAVSPYASGNWGSQTNLDTTSTNIAYVTSSFYAGYLAPVLLTSGSGSPYNVVFNSVTIADLPAIPNILSPTYGGVAGIGSTTPSLTFNEPGDYINLEWGNLGATDAQVSTSVWNSNYLSVHHLKESGNGTSNEFVDSTTGANHGQGGAGTAADTPTRSSTGKIGYAQTFDGSTDFIRHDTYSAAPGSTLTVCAWVNPSNTTGEQRLVTLNRNPTNYDKEWVFMLNGGKAHFWDFDVSTGFNDLTGLANTTLSTSTWSYICFVKNSTAGTYYYNGSADGTKTAALNATYGTADYILGKDYRDNNKWFNGSMDEVRVSNTNLGAEWISNDYLSQTNSLTVFNNQESAVNSGYSYRKQIGIKHTFTSANTNFPILVKLDSTNFDMDAAKAAGADIRFYDRDGTTALSYEIERWDAINTANRSAYIWVNVPTVEVNYVKYKVYLYNGSGTNGTDCTGTLLETGDQTASQTGFSGQDAQTSTAYNSTTTATYTTRSGLARGSSYCYQVQAIEPGYANTFGSKTPPVVFTVSTTAAVPTLMYPPSGATGVPNLPLFQLRTTDVDGDYTQYKIVLYGSDCTSAPAPYGSVQTFDQNASQTNWQGQDNGSSTGYLTSSNIAQSSIGKYQLGTTALNASTTYCWKAAAIDPGGSNTYSSYSSTQTFTTGNTANQVIIKGGVKIQGGSKIQ